MGPDGKGKNRKVIDLDYNEDENDDDDEDTTNDEENGEAKAAGGGALSNSSSNYKNAELAMLVTKSVS